MPVSIITGATSGIGSWIALGLAHAGHEVVIIARDPKRAEATRAWIAQQMPGAKVELLIADLSLLSATAQAGAELAQRYKTIDVLMANAGVFCTRREETVEGHERVIAVNHLSPFVLTRALLPALQAKGGRIVYTGSSSSDRAKIYPNDLEGRRHWGLLHTYGQSKLALTMTTIGWARRLQGTGVAVNVVHPGLVATNIVRARGVIGGAWQLISRFALTEEKGADSPLYVALSPEYATISGAYVKRRKVVPANRLTKDENRLSAVWNATERLVDATANVAAHPIVDRGSLQNG
jgi:NAD(P)-dependent dehydrogenase (short-subunit alcohol dehydrogenase family)